MVVTTSAVLSERRLNRLLNPHLSVGLPAFLTKRGGLNSGLMIAQVTAAALVSENKTLAHPACVDSIPTSANKEDFVSMGAFAALKAREIVGNVLRVIAIELLCGAQGLEFREGLRPGRGVAAAHDFIRESIPPDSPIGGAGGAFIGVKSSKYVSEMRGSDTKLYGVYR
jgi:histidine ammonia-lyase